jgi:hypothetical protein
MENPKDVAKKIVGKIIGKHEGTETDKYEVEETIGKITGKKKKY